MNVFIRSELSMLLEHRVEVSLALMRLYTLQNRKRSATRDYLCHLSINIYSLQLLLLLLFFNILPIRLFYLVLVDLQIELFLVNF